MQERRIRSSQHALERRHESTISPEKEEIFRRIFILNRGEIAIRYLKVCQRLNIGAVVGYSEADANSPAVREVLKLEETDERYAAAFLGGTDPRYSYENIQAAIDSANAYKCDAIAPGYGFLAENPQAVKMFTEAGIKWIGPSKDAMEKLGDKANARALARKLRIRTLKGTVPLKDQKQALRKAKRIGFPVMIKAANAGGGNGNRVINTQEELDIVFFNLSEQFGALYLEKYTPDIKHIEIQVAADQDGNVIALGNRDCSAQRQFQKVLEESPASSIPIEARQKMTRDAIKLTKEAGYENLGTIEFLFDPAANKHYFLEANTRIQVEHPVTEMRIGLDLVELQLRIAQGKQIVPVLEKDNHVIEARIYAEKSQEGFAADSGTIHHLRVPQGEGIRFDPAYEEGDIVPQGYDKTIGKIIVEDSTREGAIGKLTDALHEFEATGVATNKDFLLWLIKQEAFTSNKMTTTFIEDAWRKYQQPGLHEIRPFLEQGYFAEEVLPRRIAPEKLPQNLVYERQGESRNYFQELKAFQNKNPENCAFRFGIYEEAGIRLALGFWDFSSFGGTMGAEEGNAVAALFEKASKLDIPVVMITNSGGARQQENTIALVQMDYVNAAKVQYPVPMIYNIYFSQSFGGTNISPAEQADQKYIVAGSKTGFTGTAILANIQGKSVDEVSDSVHTASDHFWNRNVDVIVRDPKEAIERILYEQSILELGNTVRRRGFFVPSTAFETFDSPSPIQLYSASSQHRFPALVSEVSHFTETMLKRLKHGKEIYRHPEELTNEERLTLIMDPYRPTTAEFLSEQMKVFDKVSPFSNANLVQEAWQYPPIIGAFARLGEKRVMILGQQTQRKTIDGQLVKEYIGGRPEDYRWATKKMQLADKTVDAIVLIGDSTGGDASEKSEAGGIMNAISDFITTAHEINIPAYSILVGINGSGGGIGFARPLNGAAEYSNALSFVADPRVMGFITSKQWPTDQQLKILLNGLRDSRPEVRRTMHFIDDIFTEPVGGMQTDPLLAGRQMRSFLLRMFAKHKGWTQTQIKNERWERSRRAAQFATEQF